MNFPVETILNLLGMKVLSCQEIEGTRLIIEIEANVKYCNCQKCGQISRSIHQNYWRIIQNLPWSGKLVLLKINHRQVRNSAPDSAVIPLSCSRISGYQIQELLRGYSEV